MDENFALRACATRTWPGAVAELELSLSIHNDLGKLGGGGSLLIHTMVQLIAVVVKIAMDFLNFIFSVCSCYAQHGKRSGVLQHSLGRLDSCIQHCHAGCWSKRWHSGS